MNELYLIKSGDNGFVEETSAVISADSGEISINDSLYVEPAGNIGIGSSNPVNKLDVVGSASISSDLTVNGITFSNVGGNAPGAANDIIMWDGSDWVVAAASQLPGGGGGAGNSDVPAGLITTLTQGDAIHEVIFGYDGTNARIVYDNVPKIAASLEIDGPGEIIPHTVSGVSESGYFVVFSEELPTANYRMHTVFGGTDAFWETGVANLEYSERSVDITRSLYVGQKVGIGTTNPICSLDVHNSSNLDTGQGLRIRTRFEGVNSNALLVKNEGGSGDNYFVVRNDGNVGIGTASPDRNLVIDAGANSSPLRLIARSSDENCAIQIRNSANTNTVTQLGGNIDSYFTGGNVGIGTTSPGTTLEVKASSSSNLILDNDQSGGFVDLRSSGTNQGYLQWGMTPAGSTTGDDLLLTNTTTNGGFAVTKSGVAQLYVKADGNVGIGTTSPSAKLDIQNGHILVKQSANTAQENILLQGSGYVLNANLYGNVSIRSDYSSSSNSGSLNFYTASTSTATTERMRIAPNGNVGIGTTNPIGKLSVVGDNADIFLQQSDGTISAQVVSDASGNGKVSVNNSVGNPICHLDSNGVSYINGGNVGIGVTNPSAILHIKNSNNHCIKFGYGGSYSEHQIRWDSATAQFHANYDQASSNASRRIVFGVDSSEKMSIKHDGNVGIGTTSPDCRLTIVADNAPSGYAMKVGAGGGGAEDRGIYIAAGKTVPASAGDCVYIGFHDGDGSSSGGVRCSSSSTAPEFFSGSDVRMKKNIEDCDINGIEKIKSLKLRKWDWNTEKDMSPTDLGLIADELEEVYPELVSRQKMDGWEHCVSEGEEDLKTIPSESKITLTLVKAIQEQQTIIEDLKSRIENLEK